MDKYIGILGVVVGGLIGIITIILNNWNQIKLEKIKLHSKDSFDAHKEVFMLAHKICNNCFPLSERKRVYFIVLMKDSYINRIERNYVYFSLAITKILDHFNDMYQCIEKYELQEFTEDIEEFLEKDLFDEATKLADIVKKECKRYEL